MMKKISEEPLPVSGVPSGGDGMGPRGNSRQLWMVIAALIVAIGAGASAFGFSAIRATSARSHKAFQSSAVQISGTLQLAIQHEQDLIVSTESFIIGNPHPSQAEFTQWADDIGALKRYPELFGLVAIQFVPAAQLEAYAQSVSAKGSAPFTVKPAGPPLPFYCFVRVGVEKAPFPDIPDNYNLCVGTLARNVLAARASGKSAVLPLTAPGSKTLALDVPIYGSGSTPSTVAGRDSSFVELIAMDIRPNVLLETALRGHANTAVALRFGSGKSAVMFQGGHAPVAPQIESINLGQGWTVEALGPDDSGGLIGTMGGLPLLLGGIALSLLLGASIYVLGSGRARSRALVHERTDELKFQAMHDPLTGLPNRALILDRIDQLLARGRRNGTVGAALYIDLDDFKNVNDSLGHEAGDELLASVAIRMASTLRGADTIGRMGGDEFVVLIDGSEPMVAPELVAERLLDVMRQPFELNCASSLPASASIGIAVGDRATPGELLRDADIALYQAKARGKNRYEFFHPEMQTDIGRRIRLEFDLRSALSAHQFRLVYQPILNLADLSVIGVEALLRWEHPADGLLAPDEFIPILEQSGQIREVGAWVLRQACAQMAVWRRQSDELTLSVNVSGRQLDDDRIVEHIRCALYESKLHPTALTIEVTETALMRDTSSAVRRLRAIEELGVGIAVDDFGTGYSSLAFLQQFPVHCIKIDKSFVRAMVASRESAALIKTFVQLGRDLGLTTLAEGVETTDEMDLLRANHCLLYTSRCV